MVLRVLFLYIPLPMFWALFDQQVAATLSFPPDGFSLCVGYALVRLEKCLKSKCVSSVGLQVDLPGHHHGRQLCKFSIRAFFSLFNIVFSSHCFFFFFLHLSPLSFLLLLFHRDR